MTGTLGTPTAPVVFITGASSGIGQALALDYARAGWRVFLVARREAALREWMRSQGLSDDMGQAHGADVEDVASIIDAAHHCLRDFGLPEVVIANAGISVGFDTADREDLDVMRHTLQTNVLGMAATFHAFIEPMRQARRGTLVGIGSVGGVRGMPGHGAYCGSKAAVMTYCESLRLELRGQGIRVVTLVPGFVDTPLTRHNPYPMPFKLSAPEFARRARRAIARGSAHTVIPWQMGVVATLLRWAPRALFDRVFAGRARKPRRR